MTVNFPSPESGLRIIRKTASEENNGILKNILYKLHKGPKRHNICRILFPNQKSCKNDSVYRRRFMKLLTLLSNIGKWNTFADDCLIIIVTHVSNRGHQDCKVIHHSQFPIWNCCLSQYYFALLWLLGQLQTVKL